ncbi:MAG: bis(5'-nucleosyl)-tetraphosphatase (symmetrical) YqeK [Oscillospiraceae bacterium]|nr:bis(5'-nucleosyl)-tetraphosphatase (symmetrical) YqeK [Oscillospiraceae bacterium]MBQ2998437.1 bis(5'-nucleosyl)-tetraphosphatase (symmetrical) YqeK [Oscillospiraceae bacterium]MBQ3561265.1 bis(5'-nucleosyl)-tetraphosphatase (symmetrical) YqeK [Oscillospiraceae bacterium]MBQ4118050.1 bis(5'-nucleosyl)-tetraphosphatase (symmetrical) YqeK [Oscillospiraceae bacterium]MBQ6700635.1 bis(5'-nucleosyl)-tetraphosphatase (symmetrical) YqeK [Oscillospiraceae bacterium]
MMDTKKYCRFTEDEIKTVLKNRMNEHRYEHSLNVAKRAAFLAEKYGADAEKARFAGLIHDICKGIPQEEQLAIIEKEVITLDENTKKSPALWHSIAGAIYCEHELGVTDKDVLNAVRYHTSGRGNMSILEKVVYMADLTSAERNYPDAEYTRNLTDKSLDEGIAYGVRWIAGDLERRGLPKGKDTEALLEEYKNVKITE